MQFTIIKGWLQADTERVRLAAVTSYRPYGEMGVELVTPATVHRFTLTTEAPSEPEPTLAAAVAAVYRVPVAANRSSAGVTCSARP